MRFTKMRTRNRELRKVLMTADPLGGVWTYVLELAHALRRHGVEFALATMGGPLNAVKRRAIDKCSNVRLFESSYRVEWTDEPWKDVDLAGEWLLNVAAEVDPDVVHLSGYNHATLPWGRPVLITAHSCVLSWWRAVKGESAPAAYDEYARRVRTGLAAADLVVAPSAAMLAALTDEYGVHFESRVIPNAVSHDGFTPAVKRPFIFAAGRVWDEAKNLATLDRAAASVPWPVQIAGNPVHSNGGRFEFQNANSLGDLAREDVARWLAHAAIFAWPAIYEPFGLAPLEAGLCSCALVLGDIASLREIWNDAALFVSATDTCALEDALNYLIEHPSAREEMALRARARALQFSPEKMAIAYARAYRDCLERKGGRPPGAMPGKIAERSNVSPENFRGCGLSSRSESAIQQSDRKHLEVVT
jgi:glycogen(starch) synthase